MTPTEVPAGLAVQGGEDMLVYCAVTHDKYEHISHIADSGAGLARILGVKPETLRSYLSRGQTCKGYKIERVEIDDEGEN